MVGQLAVGGEHGVVDGHGHVVDALGQVALLHAVVQVVLRGEAAVGVLGGVVHAVVVVPERPGVLEVRVPVVLVLPGVRDVVGVAVVLRERCGPVQVGRRLEGVPELRVGVGQAVDDADLDRQAGVDGVGAVDVDDRAGDADGALDAGVVDVRVAVHRGLETRDDVGLRHLLDDGEQPVRALRAVLERPLHDPAAQLRAGRELRLVRRREVRARPGC